MAEVFDGIDEQPAEWIAAQPLFFVATADVGRRACQPAHQGTTGHVRGAGENEVASRPTAAERKRSPVRTAAS